METTDIRFTQPKKGGAVYAISLAWPQDSRALTIKSINEQTWPGKIASVSLLGRAGEVKFTRGADGLQVELPTAPPGVKPGQPFALKILP